MILPDAYRDELLARLRYDVPEAKLRHILALMRMDMPQDMPPDFDDLGGGWPAGNDGQQHRGAIPITAQLSAFGHTHTLRLRYVYLCELETEEEGGEQNSVAQVSRLELLSWGVAERSPKWEPVSMDLLGVQMMDSLDEQVLSEALAARNRL